MKNTGAVIQCIVLLMSCNLYSQADPSTMTDQVREWSKLKYGMFIHFGMSTYDGQELSDGTTPVDEYNPGNLDVEQWVRTAKSAGMKYAVLTAKHVSGFCLWDSKAQWKGKEFAYDVAQSPVKIDVVAAFMEACKKYNIVPGVYYCSMDRRHSSQKIVWNPSLPFVSDEYFQLMKDHLTELHKQHPAIAIQWIDIPRHLTYQQRSSLYNLVRNINPDCLVMYNYGKESAGIKGEYTIEEARKVTWPTDIFNSEVTAIARPFKEQQQSNGVTYELGYEHCISLVNNWFWKAGDNPKSLAVLVSVWNQTRNLNGNLLLNVPPDKTGKLPEASVQKLNELRNELKLDTMTSTAALDNCISGYQSISSTGYPNPFSSELLIQYSLHTTSDVTVEIYDNAGRIVETIVNSKQVAGTHQHIWKPKTMPNGIYYYRVNACNQSARQGRRISETQRLIFQK